MKKILTSIFIVAFAANLFCCCIAKAAMVQLFAKQSCPSCAKKDKPENPNGMLCMVKAPFDQAVKIFSLVPLTNLFLGLIVLFFTPFFNFYRPQLVYLHSPPGRRTEYPLYIQLANLRI
jgi:hypothetical protein